MSSDSLKAFLPKKALPTDKSLSSVLRVNLAGELGAVALYEGQLKALVDDPNYSKIAEMKHHEEEHRAIFQKQCGNYGARPSLLTPLWMCLGNTFGYMAGLFGFEAAMAQTEAVETVIEKHYEEQLQIIDNESVLYQDIKKCHADEQHHRQEGASCSSDTMMLDVWRIVIQKGTSAAISVAKRI